MGQSNLHDVAFVDVDTASGAQWTVQTSGTGETLYGVAFANGARGWTVGSMRAGAKDLLNAASHQEAALLSPVKAVRADRRQVRPFSLASSALPAGRVLPAEPETRVASVVGVATAARAARLAELGWVGPHRSATRPRLFSALLSLTTQPAGRWAFPVPSSTPPMAVTFGPLGRDALSWAELGCVWVRFRAGSLQW